MALVSEFGGSPNAELKLLFSWKGIPQKKTHLALTVPPVWLGLSFLFFVEKINFEKGVMK